jgi:hypothetical protein
LPLSISEYWDNFYANDAPYFVSKALTEKGDDVHSWSDWFPPSENHFREWHGKTVEKQRNLEVAVALPSNPFTKNATATKHFLLISQTDTNLEIAVIDSQKGFPYAETFETLQLWEVKATDPRSNQIAVRHSYKLDWNDRPWAMGGTIERTTHDKIQTAVEFYKDY